MDAKSHSLNHASRQKNGGQVGVINASSIVSYSLTSEISLPTHFTYKDVDLDQSG
ncbi:MAG: hypothetical protein PHP42_10590 [Bacteroidota bacterium]|nr:hypothetical protein [Bacteroidota bacterium]